jgi:hypothetical protein
MRSLDTFLLLILNGYTKSCKNPYSSTKLYKYVEYVWIQVCMYISSSVATLTRGGQLAGGMVGGVGQP